jgi:hypothetical protein
MVYLTVFVAIFPHKKIQLQNKKMTATDRLNQEVLDNETSGKVAFLSYIIPAFAETYKMTITDLSESILEALILEKNYDEKTALDIFYTSNTFVNLSDKNTELYKKTWQEIYEMLKKELR